jgi:hypothetical protein
MLRHVVPAPLPPSAADNTVPKVLVDVSQVAGAALSLLALLAAIWAMGKTNRDLAKERRRQHDLEVLRDIAETVAAVENIPPHILGEEAYVVLKERHKLKSQLLMLPSANDFATTRAAVGARADEEAIQRFEADHGAAVNAKRADLEQQRRDGHLPDWRDVDEEIDNYRFQIVVRAEDSGGESILRKELDAAIEERMK